MIIFINTIIACIFVYILLTCYSLNKKFKTIVLVEDAIEFMLDKRFKYIESIVSLLENKNTYEETPLYEITQLRGQAQKYKKKLDKHSEYFCESKITKLIQILNTHKNDFNVLKNSPQIDNIIDNLMLAETQLCELIVKYNKIIVRYNKAKSSWLGSIIVSLLPTLNRDIEDWPN